MGVAGIATRSVIPAILAAPGNYLKSIASRSKEKAVQAAALFQCEAVCGYDSLLADPEIQAVYIPLPTGLHYQWVIKALEAGKHVLVEKAAAVTVAEATHMVELARKNALALVENFQFTRHSQHNRIKQMISEGKIGAIRCFRASFGFPPFEEDTNIRYKKELGGGALLDAGAYTLRAASMVLGSELVVKASRLVLNDRHDVDWYGGIFLTQNGTGAFAELAFGFDNFYQCNYEVWGSRGKLTVNRAYTARADYSPTVLLEQNNNTEVITLPPDDHFYNMIAHFHNIVETGNWEPEREHLLTQIRLIEATRLAAQL